jgi:DNA-directed RNA polymerase subunit alpha
LHLGVGAVQNEKTMSILAFQMPEKVAMEKADDFHGLFTFKPLEKGYGVTIGNALRRILLSSLEGYAITGIKIPNVLHEFSAIEGVVEDVSDIILNLKMVRFKKIAESFDNKITVNVKGKTELKAGDLSKFTTAFEILNPDHVICHLDTKADLEIELTIDKGRGYLPAEENKPAEQVFGFIPIDAVFTPIKNVKYSVENTRVEQKTDYEMLIIDIETDGSIHPEDALKGAAHILIQHFMLFSDQNMILETGDSSEPEAVDEEMLHMRKLLKTPLHDMDLSVRAYNCLKAADVRTLGDLVSLEISDMMKFRNFGKKSLAELEQLVAEKNMTFGMDLSKYKLEEE